MRRILCFIDTLGVGGAQRQMVGLALFLKQKEYDVTVLVYHDEPFYYDTLLSGGVPFIYLKKAEGNYTRPLHVYNYIKHYNPDIVISYIETPCICACIARLFKRFRLIVSERNTTQKTGNNEKIRFNLYRKADFVVPNAYAQEDYIKHEFPFLADKVVTIPNFVDLQRFHPNYHKRKDVSEIIVVATIWPSKNTLGFIDAVDLLLKRKREFHISWYGKDEANIEYYNVCKKKIEEKKLGGYISLLEKTNQIADRYREADYFCLPSFYEGTPNVICEAMASGLPIICSNVCDNPRYVVDSNNGSLFNPGDPENMAEVIERMLSINDDEYSSYCHRSRLIAEEKLSKERFINQYLKLIEQ